MKIAHFPDEAFGFGVRNSVMMVVLSYIIICCLIFNFDAKYVNSSSIFSQYNSG